MEVLEELEGLRTQLYDNLFRLNSDDTISTTATVAAATDNAAGVSCVLPTYPSVETVSAMLGTPELPPQLFDSPAAAAAAAAAGGSAAAERSEAAARITSSTCPGCLRSSCTILVTEIVGFALPQTTSPRVRASGVSLLNFLSRLATVEVLLVSLLPFLTQQLQDPIPTVRLEAVRALTAALLQLGAALHHENTCPFRSTREALCDFCGAACYSQADSHHSLAPAYSSSSSSTAFRRSRKGSSIPHNNQKQQLCENRRSQADAAALFCDYILPALQRLSAADADAAVRVAVAEHLPLMLLAVRACLHAQSLRSLYKQPQQHQQQGFVPGTGATTATATPATPGAAHAAEENGCSSSATAARAATATAGSNSGVSPQFAEGEETLLLQGSIDGSEVSPFAAEVAARIRESSSSSSSSRLATACGATDARQPDGLDVELPAAAGPRRAAAAESEGQSSSSFTAAAAAGEHLSEAIAKLHASVQPLLQQLLTCRPVEQRLALLRRLPLLAALLGPSQTHGFLLRYLIVQLNDPCAAVRAAVIQSIGYMGTLAVSTAAEACVIPCCEQCFLDRHDEVVVAAAAALTRLATDGLLKASSAATAALLRRRVMPLLLHPSLLLRSRLLQLLVAIEKSWGPAQSYALLLPLLRPVVRRGVALLSVQQLAAALRPPLCWELLLFAMQPQQPDSSSSNQMLLCLLFSPTALLAARAAHSRRGSAAAATFAQKRQQQQRRRVDASSHIYSDSSTDGSSSTCSSDEEQTGSASEGIGTSRLGSWQVVVEEAERRLAAGVPADETARQQQRQKQPSSAPAVASNNSSSNNGSKESPAQELARFLHRIGAANRHALLLLLPTLHARRQAAAANAAATAATDEGKATGTACPLGSSVGTVGRQQSEMYAELGSAAHQANPRSPCCRGDATPSKRMLLLLLWVA